MSLLKERVRDGLRLFCSNEKAESLPSLVGDSGVMVIDMNNVGDKENDGLIRLGLNGNIGKLEGKLAEMRGLEKKIGAVVIVVPDGRTSDSVNDVFQTVRNNDELGFWDGAGVMLAYYDSGEKFRNGLVFQKCADSGMIKTSIFKPNTSIYPLTEFQDILEKRENSDK